MVEEIALDQDVERYFRELATAFSRDMRGQLVDLLTDYQARVRIVYVEAGIHSLHRQNRDRAHVVPAKAIADMMDRWEVPAPFEADLVEWWLHDKPHKAI